MIFLLSDFRNLDTGHSLEKHIRNGRIVLTISDRIFERLGEMSMTQQEFSNKTGILPSTISEWKKNKANPSSDKIMAICKALRVSPEWLLSGVEAAGSRRDSDYYTIHKQSNMGRLITLYGKIKPVLQGRVIGYVEALSSVEDPSGGKACRTETLWEQQRDINT